MDPWVWTLIGIVAGLLLGHAISAKRLSVWRASSTAWEESAKMLDDEVKELQDELRPPR